MADYAGVLADLERRKWDLEQELSALQVAIIAIERIIGATTNARATGDPVAGTFRPASDADAYAQLTMKQALTKYLEPQEREVSTRQIADGLLAGGYKTKSQSFTNVVYNNLNDMSKGEKATVIKGANGWRLQTDRSDLLS